MNSQSDEPCEGAGGSTRMDSAKLEDLGEDSTDTEGGALRSCSKDLAQEVDDIVLTHSNSNEEIARSRAGDDPNVGVEVPATSIDQDEARIFAMATIVKSRR